MPTYVYETIPGNGQGAERFEVRQGRAEAPLTRHPATGGPVRRGLSGGLATFTGAGGGGGRSEGMGGGCGTGCGCVG